MKSIIVIEVRGGVVQEVYVQSQKEIRVFVADRDNEKDGEKDFVFERWPLSLTLAPDDIRKAVKKRTIK